MVYQKIPHLQFTYHINLSNLICPVCGNIGQYHQEDEDVLCDCGCIIYTPNKYVAGIKINTNVNFHTQKEGKNDKIS